MGNQASSGCLVASDRSTGKVSQMAFDRDHAICRNALQLGMQMNIILPYNTFSWTESDFNNFA